MNLAIGDNGLSAHPTRSLDPFKINKTRPDETDPTGTFCFASDYFAAGFFAVFLVDAFAGAAFFAVLFSVVEVTFLTFYFSSVTGAGAALHSLSNLA